MVINSIARYVPLSDLGTGLEPFLPSVVDRNIDRGSI